MEKQTYAFIHSKSLSYNKLMCEVLFYCFKMILILLCLTLITIALFLYYQLANSYDYWSKKRVPHEKPALIFGNLRDSVLGREHFAETLTKLYKKFSASPYFGIYVFHKPVLVLRDPEVIKRVLVKDFDRFTNYAGPGEANPDPVTAHSLIGVKDAVWKNLRAKLTPVFSSGKLKLMFPLMKQCCEDFEVYLGKHESQVVDVRETCKKLSVDIISSCAFGIDTNCLKYEEAQQPTRIFEMSAKLLDFTQVIRGISLFAYFYIPRLFTMFKLTFADKTASEYLVNIFKASYRARTENNVVRHDLIEHLHNLKKVETADDNYKFDDLKMASQALTFFFGGNDTTSLTSSYILYELALNPHICDRLRDEIRKHEDITYDTLQNMKYLDMVIAESQRRRPSGSSLNRVSGASYHFDETDFTLDEGISIMVPFCALHLDEKHFPEPETFDPERFNAENKQNIQPFTFLPFGEGPRSCIGQRFALLVVKLSIIYAIRNYNFRICDKTLIPMELERNSILFLQPKGNKLYLKLERI